MFHRKLDTYSLAKTLLHFCINAAFANEEPKITVADSERLVKIVEELEEWKFSQKMLFTEDVSERVIYEARKYIH